MNTLKTFDSSILSFIILIIMYVSVYIRYEKTFLLHKIFISLVRLNMVLIIIDVLSWAFDGRPGTMNFVLNNGFNMLIYLIEPLAPMLWILYADFQVFHDENRIRKLAYPLTILFGVNAIIAISSFYTGWFFYITSNNVYHRGLVGYWGHIIFCFSLLFYSFLIIFSNKERLQKSHYYALLLFAVPQVVGSVIQTFFIGMSLSWSGMMVSLLIVYFYIQDHSLNTDYLTGVYNRRQLDKYVKKRILESTPEKSFAMILIDLNNFKQINDTLGHDVGDLALQNCVKIIKSCLRKQDFIARYGGDEFYILLDFNDPSMLEFTVERIHHAIAQFNTDNTPPYKLSLCMGYDVYRYEEHLTSEGFLKHIDILMYKNKEIMKNTGY